MESNKELNKEQNKELNKELAEESLKDCCVYLAKIRGGEVAKNEKSIATVPIAGDFSWYNRTFLDKGFDGELQTPLVCFSDYNADDKMKALIKDSGYVPMVSQAGMVLDLEKYVPMAEAEKASGVAAEGIGSEIGKSSGVVIERIGEADIDEWSTCVCEAFKKPPENVFKGIGSDERLYIYACRKDGKIIGSTMLFVENKNAGIHEVGMLDEFRGKGYAKLLLDTALVEGKRLGAEYASLQASDLGRPLYERLGFEVVSKIETYIKPPKDIH